MRFPHANVTLLNLAASESTQERGMVVPFFDTGLPNYYGAQLSAESDGLRVLTCAIDSLALTRPVPDPAPRAPRPLSRGATRRPASRR